MQTLAHERRLRLAETIKFGANPPDPWPTVRQAAEEAEGENPSQPPFSGGWVTPGFLPRRLEFLQLSLGCHAPAPKVGPSPEASIL